MDRTLIHQTTPAGERYHQIGDITSCRGIKGLRSALGLPRVKMATSVANANEILSLAVTISQKGLNLVLVAPKRQVVV